MRPLTNAELIAELQKYPGHWPTIVSDPVVNEGGIIGRVVPQWTRVTQGKSGQVWFGSETDTPNSIVIEVTNNF